MIPTTGLKPCPEPLQDMPLYTEKIRVSPLYMGMLWGRQGRNVKILENFKVGVLGVFRNVLRQIGLIFHCN